MKTAQSTQSETLAPPAAGPEARLQYIRDMHLATESYPGHAHTSQGHGERSRSQPLLKLPGLLLSYSNTTHFIV